MIEFPPASEHIEQAHKAMRPPWADLMHKLRSIPEGDYWYLGTPYTKYPLGIEAAFRDAARLTAALEHEQVPVYSPICHAHPIAVYGGIDPLDGPRWLAFDAPMMRHAHGLLIGTLPTWQDSSGIRQERTTFHASGKPIEFLPQDFVQAAVQLAAARKAA